MKRSILVVLALLLAPALEAQVPAVRVQWDHTEAPALASTFAFTYKLDAAAPIPLTATCVANGTGSRCSAPIAPLAAGQHTIFVTATSALGSATSAPLTGASPSTPVNVTIAIVISIP